VLAVPNISEGRDPDAIRAIAAAFAGTGARVLDVSSDVDHHRTVVTLEGDRLAEALASGVEEAVRRIDLTHHAGAHPRVGAVDVAPVVYLDAADRGAAIAEALVAAELIGALGVPVFLYGELAGGRTRAELRRDLTPFTSDYGPRALHPTAGATLVAARPPLAAFNVEIEGTLDDARRIAVEVRRLPGVKALGLELPEQGIVQVSTNVEDLGRTTPGEVVAAVRRHATVTAAELVAPAPRSAFESFPSDVPLKGSEKAVL
jgi:glutamate formiminotransferase